MTPEEVKEVEEAKEKYGATHYATMKNDTTPQMFYKREHIHYNDATSKLIWVYLSYCNIWMGSAITESEVEKLKLI